MSILLIACLLIQVGRPNFDTDQKVGRVIRLISYLIDHLFDYLALASSVFVREIKNEFNWK